MEALSFIFGGVFRVIPEVMKLWDKKQERKHEIEMLAATLKADEARAKVEMQKMELQGEISTQLAEMQAIVAATNAQAIKFEKTGNKVLDALLVLAETASSFVRPLLTYWFCVGAYGAYKAASLSMLFSQNVPWDKAVLQLWTPYDQSVVLSIVGFWFVDRAIRKSR